MKVKEYADLEWITNEFLQQQRLAHEALGLVTWSRCTTAVPTTKPRQLLAILDLTDVDHPQLRHVENLKGDIANSTE